LLVASLDEQAELLATIIDGDVMPWQFEPTKASTLRPSERTIWQPAGGTAKRTRSNGWNLADEDGLPDGMKEPLKCFRSF
jgi:hypothetical protein